MEKTSSLRNQIDEDFDYYEQVCERIIDLDRLYKECSVKKHLETMEGLIYEQEATEKDIIEGINELEEQCFGRLPRKYERIRKRIIGGNGSRAFAED